MVMTYIQAIWQTRTPCWKTTAVVNVEEHQEMKGKGIAETSCKEYSTHNRERRTRHKERQEHQSQGSTEGSYPIEEVTLANDLDIMRTIVQQENMRKANSFICTQP